MGIGSGIFLIALGAILALGVNADPQVINLDVVGAVLMLAGAAVLALTVWFWRSRRRRSGARLSLVDETRAAHRHGPIQEVHPPFDP